MHSSLSDVAVCPRCRTPALQAFTGDSDTCAVCGNCVFDLGGVPCWFPSGTLQRDLWEDLSAKFLEQVEESRHQHLAELGQPGLTPQTRQRLATMLEMRMGTADSIAGLLRTAGISPRKHARFASYTPESFVQYYELMLRDWAWHSLGEDTYRTYQDENRESLDAVCRVLDAAGTGSFGRVLVLGSGAGRLSWDLHQMLKPQFTVALDQHPLLIFVSHLLVRQGGSLSLFDTRKLPQQGLPQIHEWVLRCPAAAPAQHESWFAIAGDAWHLPFAEQSFDLVVTPWFVDITGKDCKSLMALVERVLKPGGCWLNHGPLLYSDTLPESQKYTFAELRELLSLGHFQLQAESFSLSSYTHSPLSQRGRLEEVWTFVARSASNRQHLANAGNRSNTVSSMDPPPWMVLPHLPVPRLTKPGLFPAELDNIARLIDGTRSINQLAEILAPKLPEGHDALAFVYGFFTEYVIDR
jgi:hypothetical protein